MFIVEVYGFVLLTHLAVNVPVQTVVGRAHQKALAVFFAFSLYLLMGFKRVFFRNHPYRFPRHANLGLPNELGSFPSVNLFVATTAPFATMRAHSQDLGRAAQVMLGLALPVVFTKLHLGTSHLSDLLLTLGLVAWTHQGLLANWLFEVVRQGAFLAELTRSEDETKL